MLWDESVSKTTKSDALDEVMVDLAEVQNLPSDDEMELEPSYSDTLS